LSAASPPSHITGALQAIRFLETCTGDPDCLNENSSDLLSTWFNLALLEDPTISDAAKKVITSRYTELTGVIEAMAERNQNCVKRGNIKHCAISTVITSLHAKRYGVVLDEKFKEIQNKVVGSVGIGLQSMLGEVRSGRPNPAQFDSTVVVAYAAHLAGLSPGGAWEPSQLLRATTEGGWQPPQDSETVQVGSYLTSQHGEYRDEVWMVMHLVYVACEFGLYQLPSGTMAREVAHLLNGLSVGMERMDPEMVGELLDCLEVAGQAVGDDGTHRMHAARVWLTEQQTADGSWPGQGEPVHRAYVACLGLVPRDKKRQHKATSQGHFNAIDAPAHWAAVQARGLGTSLQQGKAADTTEL